MAISELELARIDALLSALGGAAQPDPLAIALQRLVPGLALRRCDASDVLEEPFRSAGACDLHLLDTADHCLLVTDQPERAGGLLLAARASQPEVAA
ncbi:hypothetical protein MTR62_04485 [Novosphingobium sp. 1949]|uniref:Uncharacterized protein n=1 Tax=Novosphingobium organovorum TaxID=2930092 RepID=A0ABT0BA61_9SPHN|nr:hypothetical protein [Novosphingobium organovorum]MCJ2181962.1 hypothetical protein [Novosphingobium organovorum]